MSDSLDDIRAMTHADRMERDGLKRCAKCGEWASDTEPTMQVQLVGGVVQTTVRDLCGLCREAVA